MRCNAIAPGTFRSPSWEDRVETLGKEWGSKEKALDMFVSVYGAEAGNLALKMLATGGVFIGFAAVMALSRE